MSAAASIFARNVRRARERLNANQSELAEKAEISSNYVGEIERGEKWPSPKVLDQLCQALDLRPWQLFFDDSVDESPTTWIEAHRDTLAAQARTIIEMTSAIRQLTQEKDSLRALVRTLQDEKSDELRRRAQEALSSSSSASLTTKVPKSSPRTKAK